LPVSGLELEGRAGFGLRSILMPKRNRDRRSLDFLARFAALLLFFYFLVAWRPINDAVIEPFTAAIASLSAALTNALGEPVTVVGTEIRSTGFAVKIENGCNGIETILLFGSAVLAFPAKLARKAIGLLLGFLAIEAVNLVRVISLFWIGRHHPALFSSSHTVIWQSIVVLFGVLLFLLWASQLAPEAVTPKRSREGDRA
jgi:exosortase H (IPTLxxWG-CTERM-specific)